MWSQITHRLFNLRTLERSLISHLLWDKLWKIRVYCGAAWISNRVDISFCKIVQQCLASYGSFDRVNFHLLSIENLINCFKNIFGIVMNEGSFVCCVENIRIMIWPHDNCACALLPLHERT